jgi:hypothetical protein
MWSPPLRRTQKVEGGSNTDQHSRIQALDIPRHPEFLSGRPEGAPDDMPLVRPKTFDQSAVIFRDLRSRGRTDSHNRTPRVFRLYHPVQLGKRVWRRSQENMAQTCLPTTINDLRHEVRASNTRGREARTTLQPCDGSTIGENASCRLERRAQQRVVTSRHKNMRIGKTEEAAFARKRTINHVLRGDVRIPDQALDAEYATLIQGHWGTG